MGFLYPILVGCPTQLWIQTMVAEYAKPTPPQSPDYLGLGSDGAGCQQTNHCRRKGKCLLSDEMFADVPTKNKAPGFSLMNILRTGKYWRFLHSVCWLLVSWGIALVPGSWDIVLVSDAAFDGVVWLHLGFLAQWARELRSCCWCLHVQFMYMNNMDFCVFNFIYGSGGNVRISL